PLAAQKGELAMARVIQWQGATGAAGPMAKMIAAGALPERKGLEFALSDGTRFTSKCTVALPCGKEIPWIEEFLGRNTGQYILSKLAGSERAMHVQEIVTGHPCWVRRAAEEWETLTDNPELPVIFEKEAPLAPAIPFS